MSCSVTTTDNKKGINRVMRMACLRPFGLLLALLSVALTAHGEDARIAVASSFSAPMQALAPAFERETRHRLIITYGSTARLYTQILKGAPFDAFLAANDDYPRMLEKNAMAVAGSRFTYAMGRLALWSAQPGYVDSKGQVLRNGTFAHLAIANPEFAPYGSAAKEYLRARGLMRKLMPRFLVAEDAAQAFRFVASGRAELGFVPLSHLAGAGGAEHGGSVYVLPLDSHPQLKQQAILLRPRDGAAAWLAFLQSDTARDIIQQHGYQLP